MVNLLTVGSLLQKCHKNVLWLNILLKRSMLTSSDILRPVAQPGFGGRHRGSGELKSPSGVQRQSPWWVVRGGIASRKLIAVIRDIWLPNHAQFCVFSSTAQPKIFLWTQFRGMGAVPPLAAPLWWWPRLLDGRRHKYRYRVYKNTEAKAL